MYLSATSIKDYLSCPQKFEYRLQGEEQEANAYFVRGIAVHETIENQNLETTGEAKSWFLERFSELVNERNPEFPYRNTFSSMAQESYQMLDNYYNIIHPSQPPIRQVELFFNVSIGEIEFSGKIDQIRDGSIYDWKTTMKPLDDVVRVADYQFTLYDMAYKELYGEYPRHTYYGHLYEGKLIELERTQEDYDYLYSVASQITVAIEEEIFPRNYDKYGCFYCPFKHLCFDENGQIGY